MVSNVYIYIYIHIHIYIHKHIYVCIYIQYVCICINMCVYMYVYVCVFIHRHTHVYVCICINTHTYKYTHTHIYICVCDIHIWHVYIYRYIYILWPAETMVSHLIKKRGKHVESPTCHGRCAVENDQNKCRDTEWRSERRDADCDSRDRKARLRMSATHRGSLSRGAWSGDDRCLGHVLNKAWPFDLSGFAYRKQVSVLIWL